jgi:microcystin degradation protein MlrC
MSSRRIGLGGVWHETNSFAPGLTSIEDFESYHVERGAQLIEVYESTATELGGAIAAACEARAEIAPLTYAAAIPSGMVTRSAFDWIKSRLAQDVTSAGRIDALLLVLHGAMAVENSDYPEAELVEEVRQAAPRLPIAVTVDLHANLGERLVNLVELLVGYDTFPHIDAAERGAEAVDLLLRILKNGRGPVADHITLPLLTVPQVQDTGVDPMRAVILAVREAERRQGVWTVSAVPGYPYSDVDRLGFSIYAAADRHPGDILERIGVEVWERRHQFDAELVDVDDAIGLADASPGPVVLVDVADNVGGGSPGDGTVLLAALERRGGRDAVVVMWDPVAVDDLYRSGSSRAEVGVGGRSGLGPGVTLAGIVRLPGQIVYRRRGTYMTGQMVDMGRVAVVASAAGDVVITEHRVMPFDDDHLRAAGLRPETYHVIVAKSAIAWKAAFGSYARATAYVRTPGYCPSDLASLTFSGPGRSFYPLRRDVDWSIVVPRSRP